MLPKVTIVAITVNGIMSACFNSIVGQSYSHLELIVNQQAPSVYSENAIVNKYENCHRNRNEARVRALKTAGDFFLFMDDDIILPRFAVNHLVSHRKEVIGGWYPILGTNRYVCGKWVADHTFLNYTGVHRDVVRTDVVGLGCALISRNILEKVPFEAGVEIECKDAISGQRMLLGECGAFGNRVDALGISMFMDGDVVCQHLVRAGKERVASLERKGVLAG